MAVREGLRVVKPSTRRSSLAHQRYDCPGVHTCAQEIFEHPVLEKVFLAQDFEARLAEL